MSRSAGSVRPGDASGQGPGPNAVSVSVPLAGPALATAFTFRRFTRQGADVPLAGWSLLASGVISSVVLNLIGIVLARGRSGTWDGAMGGRCGRVVRRMPPSRPFRLQQAAFRP
jgi:hypothetical protein